MHLAVFGANGPTGRLVVDQALRAGHHVTAVTRKPDTYPLTSPHLVVAEADVTDAGAVDRVLGAQPEAVISTYGVPFGRHEITVYSHGIASIIAAMTSHDVARLVCVTSTTVASGVADGESFAGRWLLKPFLRRFLGRTLYDDMERMEEIVRRSSLDWTVVRPGGLFDTTAPTADYEVSREHLVGGYTSRADLADLLVREAVAPQHSRSTIEVLTRSVTPAPLGFVKEAFGLTSARSRAAAPSR